MLTAADHSPLALFDTRRVQSLQKLSADVLELTPNSAVIPVLVGV